ncbi:hypothetical protein FJZ40_03440 [Candidatus Shapirobacteria bacterium]|nr:hypothetical protein [Candidatus Shapirobacteria bacterium]
MKKVLTITLIIILGWKFSSVAGAATCANCPCDCPCGAWEVCTGYSNCSDDHVGCSNSAPGGWCICDTSECSCAPCPPTQGPTSPPEPTTEPTEPPIVWPTGPEPTEPYHPTATPRPTSTPVPTATPTVVPTPTPTREPPASCSCWLLATEGNPNLANVKKGQTLNFIAKAYVTTPATAKVLGMKFFLQRPSQTEIVSDTIPAYFEGSETINGVKSDVYRSTWSYLVKQTDNEGLYHLNIQIFCGWKEGRAQGEQLAFGKPRVLGAFPTPIPEKTGLASLIERILSLFGRKSEVPVQTQGFPLSLPTVTPEPTFPIIARPTGRRTLQLGTFLPAPTLPAGGCTDLYFQVLGEGYF